MNPRTDATPAAPADAATSGATTPRARRRYTSSRREMQAAETRHDVLDAALRLFSESGWAGTTMADIAAGAGVAVETVYSGFGSKKALLRAAMEVGIVGDAEPVPYVDRPEFRRLGEGTLDERLRAGAEVTAAIHARTARVWAAMREAASSDAEVATWVAEMEAGRHLDVGRSLAMVFGRPLDDVQLDLIWALMSPEVYTKLVLERGWSLTRYQDELREAILRLLA